MHDEVILEGPEENEQEALARVVEVMENPLDNPLKIKLEVDAKVAKNWYDAKWLYTAAARRVNNSVAIQINQ